MFSNCLARAVLSKKLHGPLYDLLILQNCARQHQVFARAWQGEPLGVTRPISTHQRSGREAHNKQFPVQKWKETTPSQTTAQKVKEAGRDFTYLIVVLIGIGVTGVLFYVVFKELFSSSSPSKIFGMALEKCRSNPEVIGAFGEPIKGYGETTRRGRRQHVSHSEYVKDGLKYMRVKFYIEGSESRIQGTVHVEVKQNPETGKYEFCYIFVEIDTYPRRTIIIEDHRY
uniref:Mitochondrial import inner membrane translocase subunit Tim21 n=1 Tax=Geotrypetes seraphini TaxID=260995 RepID=A0A6P8Q1T5_GEOSA|nr:mitochondrial import inner membrane translocase subunit Tim21 [Geotrypetes seraphini]